MVRTVKGHSYNELSRSTVFNIVCCCATTDFFEGYKMFSLSKLMCFSPLLRIILRNLVIIFSISHQFLLEQIQISLSTKKKKMNIVAVAINFLGITGEYCFVSPGGQGSLTVWLAICILVLSEGCSAYFDVDRWYYVIFVNWFFKASGKRTKEAFSHLDVSFPHSVLFHE